MASERYSRTLAVAQLLSNHVNSRAGMCLCDSYKGSCNMSIEEARELLFVVHEDRNWTESDLLDAVDLWLHSTNNRKIRYDLGCHD
jgi:hypothetical protein